MNMEKDKITIKICGLMRAEDVTLCAGLSADILGFVTEYPAPVPWNLTSDEAAALLADAPSTCKTCLVTGGSAQKVVALAAALQPDYIQLHYHETPSQTAEIACELRALGIGVIRAVFPDAQDLERDLEELCASDIRALLADPRVPTDAARGGLADIMFFERVRGLSNKPVILAGGLTPDNVDDLLQKTGAQHIDVMTGVERSPGIKDAAMVETLIRAVRDVKAR